MGSQAGSASILGLPSASPDPVTWTSPDQSAIHSGKRVCSIPFELLVWLAPIVITYKTTTRSARSSLEFRFETIHAAKYRYLV